MTDDRRRIHFERAWGQGKPMEEGRPPSKKAGKLRWDEGRQNARKSWGRK